MENKYINFIGNEVFNNNTFENFLDYLSSAQEIVVDVETTQVGQSTISGDIHDSKMVLLQIGDKHVKWVLQPEFVPDWTPIKKVLESNKILKIGHNIKYDYKILKCHYNITMENVHDTMIGEYLIHCDSYKKPKGFFGLEQTLYRYTKRTPYSDQLSLFDPFIPKKVRNNIQINWPSIFYAATDIVSTYLVYEEQKKVLKEKELETIAPHEFEFVLTLGDCELTGMPIDVDEWIDLELWTKEQKDNLLDKLHSKYPEVENWNSNPQVAKLLKSLGVPVGIVDKDTGEEKDSVARTTIERYIDEYEVVKDLLAYKHAAKLNSSYGIKFLSKVSPVTGRVHTNFLQIKNTGRTGSMGPNMQQVPSYKKEFPEGERFRKAFKQKEGKTFVLADYSSQEMFILANRSKDKNLLKVLSDGADVHANTASVMYNIPVEDVAKAGVRAHGKTVNFAIPYGAGISKLSNSFGLSYGETKKLIESYFKGYPGIKSYFDTIFELSLKLGYIPVDKYGRKYFLTKELSEVAWYTKYKPGHPTINKLLSEIRRKAQNYGIQGSGATMSKIAGNLIRKEFKKIQGAELLLIIHDEWIAECNIEDVELVKDIIEKCMAKAAKMLCTIVAPQAKAVQTVMWQK